MMDLVKTKKDSYLPSLAHRLLGIASMAVFHTSAMSLTHNPYDLLVMLQWVLPLRDKILTEIPS